MKKSKEKRGVKKRMQSFYKEFREFALTGNVLNLAVGIIIGGALRELTDSLVRDIIMPVVSRFTGVLDLTNLSWVIFRDTEGGAVELRYGQFINTGIDFLIMALCVFLIVKFFSSLSSVHEKIICKDCDEEPKKEPEEKPTTEELLAEIRDMLKGQLAISNEQLTIAETQH